jgi:hypothetical protein
VSVVSLGTVSRFLTRFLHANWNSALLENRFAKKEQGTEPCSKIVSTLNFLENLDLILIVEATLLVRVRAPPETWTTRLGPLGQPEPELVDHLVRLVTFCSNDCSKFQRSAQ